LPQVPLVPTGGVNFDTAADFILAGCAALGVGGELVQASALRSGNTEIIAENARKFIQLVKQAREKLAASSGQLEPAKVRS
jgi:2-dehydro-3-deoxyphosphogluconate aldolase/(4S)-4-hydroxy-2-oxoglutarate aldolase